MKCTILGCIEKANYNYKQSHNPAYCYAHSTPGMVKKGKYNFVDFIEIIFYGIEKIIPEIN